MRQKTFTLLDSILEYLYKNQNTPITVNNLINTYPDYDSERIMETLKYLEKENLVTYAKTKSEDFNKINLTTEGIIKCEYNNFKKQHTRTLTDRYLPIASLIISIIALIVAIIKD